MSDAFTKDEEDRVLAAEYVLRLLDTDEERAFEARLAEDRALETEVAHWVYHLAPLSDDVAPVAPPAALKDQLFADLFGAQEPVSQAPTSLFARLGLWQGMAAAATAIAAALAVQLVTSPAPQTPASGPFFVSEIASADEGLRILALYDGATGGLRLTGTNGTAAEGRDFELWAIIGEDAPVSLGVLSDDGTGNIALPDALGGAVGGMVLAISDEPEGGSPTGAPTGAVLATGEVTDL
ncbi:MAG: anti-sigma factor [Pseudomonadota bacterium]